MLVEIIAVALILVIFVGVFFFYSSRKGIKSVYKSDYAWKIDALAIISGLYIAAISFYFYYQGNSLLILVPLFLFGAFQGMMHLAKWIVRIKKA